MRVPEGSGALGVEGGGSRVLLGGCPGGGGVPLVKVGVWCSVGGGRGWRGLLLGLGWGDPVGGQGRGQCGAGGRNIAVGVLMVRRGIWGQEPGFGGCQEGA